MLSPGDETADHVGRPHKAQLLKRRRPETRRVPVRADEDDPLVETLHVRVSVRGIVVGIEAPLENRAGNVDRPGNDAVSPSLVIRARVHDQRSVGLR